ncbi:hypothetical protein [Trinickia acidisoli]|uniref:hypothetical protein n=1 Tax=Trinickia acidisoli TaxID=2767482 RepID=UPI001A8F64F4|nr:hypothetical protein [Trinickia acidisoli]
MKESLCDLISHDRGGLSAFSQASFFNASRIYEAAIPHLLMHASSVSKGYPSLSSLHAIYAMRNGTVSSFDR